MASTCEPVDSGAPKPRAVPGVDGGKGATLAGPAGATIGVMALYEAPPQFMAPYDGSPIPEIALPGGPDLVMGRVPVSFGGPRADRGASRRMADAEQALVSQGLPLTGFATGVIAKFDAGKTWSFDAGVGVPGNVGVAQLARQGPVAPDLASRAAWSRGPVELGGSVWLGGLGVEDHAYGLDAELDVGRWTLGAAWSHQRIGAVKQVFDEPIGARQVHGDRATVLLERKLRPHWSASALLESQVFRAGGDVTLTPWGRGAVGVVYEVKRSLRWTVVELAELVTFGPSEDCQRISTRIELR